MRREVRLYAFSVIAAAGVVTALDLTAIQDWGYAWNPIVALALLVGTERQALATLKRRPDSRWT